MTSSDPVELPTSAQQIGPLLQRWLRAVSPDAMHVEGVAAATGGMSATTYIVSVNGGREGDRRLVLRMAPDKGDVSTFPSYDLGREHACLSVLADVAGVRVPRTRFEADPSWLGTPFLVSSFVDGQIPSDRPPYVLRGWMLEARPDQLAVLQSSLVRMIATVHTAPIEANGLAARLDASPDAIGAHLDEQRRLYEWGRDGDRHPAIERALAALSTSRPAPTTGGLVWGDSRVGNVIVADFRPAALIDWELASIGPPELDLGWLVFMHRYFQHVATTVDRRGIPDFLRGTDVYSTYAEIGARLSNIEWYEAFAALRFAIIAMRTTARLLKAGHRGLVSVEPLLNRAIEPL